MNTKGNLQTEDIDIMYSRLIESRGQKVIDLFLSYNVEITDLFYYFYGAKNICQCSYELQCAVYDMNPKAYQIYTDSYYMDITKNMRVDKYLKYLFYQPEFDITSFMDSFDLTKPF